MGPVISVLAMGVLTVADLLVFKSRSRVAMEVKIDSLTRLVELRNCPIECAYTIEQKVDVMEEGMKACGRAILLLYGCRCSNAT